MGKNQIDVQCLKIIAGLNELSAQLNDPIAVSVLDYEKNAKTNRYLKFLQRLKRSLTQYSEKRGGLLYVGLIGHYSAGKSSTINSILGLWEKKGSRSVGLNPTDKSITLITDSSNSQDILGIIREGSIAIRTEFNDKKLLDNLVLADTPGTGDPHLIEEMARDFLPICDLLLFFISAANPLDETDVPILQEVHSKLPFIPIRFVVTRADEFILKKQEKLSSTNFNEIKAETFLAELISRINKLTKGFDFNYNDFILIDNRENYNIDKLQNFLARASDTQNVESYLSMHSNKLNFFISNANECKKFFLNYLKSDLNEVSKIVTKAEQMIDEYQDKVQITNNKLTSDWSHNLSELQRLKNRDILILREINNLPDKIDNLPEISEQNTKILNKIETEAKDKSGNIVSFLTLIIKNTIRDYFANLRRQSEAIELHEMKLEFIDQISFDKGNLVNDQLTIYPSTNIVFAIKNYRQRLLSELNEVIDSMLTVCKKVNNKLFKKSPLSESESIIATSVESLSEDVESYFGNVVIYRASVFSHHVKSSIEKLGIGSELDSLEYDFEEDEKNKIKKLAKNNIFPNFDEIAQKYADRLSKLKTECSLLLEKLSKFRLRQPADLSDMLNHILKDQDEEFVEDLFTKTQTELFKLKDVTFDELKRNITAQTNAYNTELKKLKRDQRSWYGILFITIAIVVFTLFFFINKNFEIPAISTENIYWNIAFGTFASILANLVCLPFAIKRDRFPNKINKLERTCRSDSWESSFSNLNETLKNYKFPTDSSLLIEHKLKNSWTKIILNKDQESACNFALIGYCDILKFDAELNSIKTDYLSIIDEIFPQFDNYFSDIDANLEKLIQISDKVKKEAIEPSFMLLEETKNRLIDVKKQITKIEFS